MCCCSNDHQPNIASPARKATWSVPNERPEPTEHEDCSISGASESAFSCVLYPSLLLSEIDPILSRNIQNEDDYEHEELGAE